MLQVDKIGVTVPQMLEKKRNMETPVLYNSSPFLSGDLESV